MNFAQTAKQTSHIKSTENGAMAYDTTNNALLDLFAQIGALRPRSIEEITIKYAEAYAVSPELATKMLFYAGNIRGGLGERRTFRACLRWLAINHPNVIRDNLTNIPHFNRWDSLFVGQSFCRLRDVCPIGHSLRWFRVRSRLMGLV